MIGRQINIKKAFTHWVLNVYAALFVLYPSAAFAIQNGIIDIRPYVSASTSYDDNLFRIPSPDRTFGADTITSVGAGVNVGVRLSRQQFLIGAGLTDTKFANNTRLDNIGNNANVAWNWQLGNHLNGVLRYVESESLPGFQELRTTERSLRTTSRKVARINWQFHPSWLTFAGYEQQMFQNANSINQGFNNESDTVDVGLQYETAASTRFRLTLRDSETKFPNRSGSILSILGNQTNQQELVADVRWPATRLMTLNASFSLVELDIPSNASRNFSGTSQSFGLDYALTSNTNVSASVFKNISPIQDALVAYVEATGFSIRPTWQATSKISVGGALNYTDRDFIGSAGVFSSTQRQDQFRNVSLFVNYQFARKLSLQTNYSNENRASNVDSFVTKSNNIGVSLRFDF